MVYDAVVARAVPPVATLYQRTVDPLLAVADRVTVPAPQLAAGVVWVIVGNAFALATTASREGTHSVEA